MNHELLFLSGDRLVAIDFAELDPGDLVDRPMHLVLVAKPGDAEAAPKRADRPRTVLPTMFA